MASEPILRGEYQPVGAVLRIGRKNQQRGHPEHNDRFYIASRQESELDLGKRKTTQRLPLPEFKSFNDASESRPITVIRGELVHANREDCWTYQRRAQQLPGKDWPNHPNRRAACESKDGETATRLYGIAEDGAEDWRELPCPGRLCEYSQEVSNARGQAFRPCKVFARLYFVPRWSKEGLPAPLMMYSTGAWSTAENIESYFNFVAQRARELNLERFSFTGAPFILTLSRKTQPKSGRVFPVVDMTPDGNLIDTFAAQRANAELAGGSVPLLLGGTAPEENEPEVIDADALDLTPAVPGSLFDG